MAVGAGVACWATGGGVATDGGGDGSAVGAGVGVGMTRPSSTRGVGVGVGVGTGAGSSAAGPLHDRALVGTSGGVVGGVDWSGAAAKANCSGRTAGPSSTSTVATASSSAIIPVRPTNTVVDDTAMA